MTLRPRDRIALGVVLVLGLLGGFYKLALAPERQKASMLESQVATERARLTAAQRSYANGRQAQASLKSDVAEWNAIHLAVPASPISRRCCAPSRRLRRRSTSTCRRSR